MASQEETETPFSRQDHQAAYIFRPQGQRQSQGQAQASAERPSKRRRTSNKAAPPVAKSVPEGDAGLAASASVTPSSLFVPLLNGLESVACVQLREKLFHDAWGRNETRVQNILRDANSATLDQVATFVQAEREWRDKIASAFIITGANIASQDLLFGQLAERLNTGTRSRFVRLRSSEATNVKAALKKIIQDATAGDSSEGYDDEDVEVSLGFDDRKYLNYDLESLHVYVKAHSCQRVCVAFQDSEGFDSALLSDLVVLFSSWMPRIPFTLLFGVATSVDLLQARLLKSACRLLYGAQFDVVRTDTILEQVFKPAVAGADVLLRLGPSLLQSLIDRQHDHVAGIHSFLSSLKYAHMCHFYANPLSIFAAADDALGKQLMQPEHLGAVRTLPSFRQAVEDAVEAGRLGTARSLLDDDDYLRERILEIPKRREEWTLGVLRAVALLQALRVGQDGFPQTYLAALSEGIDLSADENTDSHHVVPSVKRMSPDEFVAMLTRVSETMRNGDPALRLPGWDDLGSQAAGADVGMDSNSTDISDSFEALAARTRALILQARRDGKPLKSAYSGQRRVVRTTVVAQKVQLSRDSAALSDADKAFTKVVDGAVALLAGTVRCVAAERVFLHETWLYDAKMPYRDVFVPRPRVVFERSLTRPHDYLACACCRVEDDEGAGAIPATLPVTSLLYHLYLETPGLINVADLWAAFYGVVGEGAGAEGEAEGEGEVGRTERSGGYDERTALVLFYRGLAELKALGFVKHSRKKVDHVAKIKWL
ncbi:origin recognition complex subunit [Sodiomyces alkalinus F11]|uniref:Origin recognition complex subunit n=1 Tax=Sodiomyces alkalinus (strain CBS 110278 / VKM F-3762 / F11) TaxID=1314773 RepID=A0A3N2PQJ0_SODAK|nr:origin recognition complex subunit [Sodiomyces alkalinus F11]ROT36777.1 origin recognition complex subunit [Sodiomyces alkalinus F11]